MQIMIIVLTGLSVQFVYDGLVKLHVVAGADRRLRRRSLSVISAA
jgi:hypothetical protein